MAARPLDGNQTQDQKTRSHSPRAEAGTGRAYLLVLEGTASLRHDLPLLGEVEIERMSAEQIAAFGAVADVRRPNSYLDLLNELRTASLYIGNIMLLVLTIVSVILLPLTLITGLFGMNVKFPGFDTARAFWIICGTMLAIAVSLIAYFRSRRWL